MLKCDGPAGSSGQGSRSRWILARRWFGAFAHTVPQGIVRSAMIKGGGAPGHRLPCLYLQDQSDGLGRPSDRSIGPTWCGQQWPHAAEHNQPPEIIVDRLLSRAIKQVELTGIEDNIHAYDPGLPGCVGQNEQSRACRQRRSRRRAHCPYAPPLPRRQWPYCR